MHGNEAQHGNGNGNGNGSAHGMGHGAPHGAAHGNDRENRFMVGLDIGSTTVKALVVNAATDEILWQDYQRHETKQPEKTLEFLKRIEAEVGVSASNTRMFVTGSGGGVLAELIGAKFVQEVTAVALAVEKAHPEVYSVIELGGQDAEDHRVQGRQRERAEEEDPVDERQVRRRHGRGDRQDQRQAENSRGGTERSGLSRHQAAQSGRKVRRVRRDGHQRLAESGHATGPVDGVAVRRHRAAEPERADARQHAEAACSAAGRTEHFYSRDEGSVASEHPENVGRAQSGNSGGNEAGRADQSAAERAVFRGAGRDRIRQGRRRLRRLLPRLSTS